MPMQAFEKLPESERLRVLGACLSEFAAKGYAAASTNAIVKGLGIPKGSLFYWFGSKEDLYLFLLGAAAERFASVFSESSRDWPREILARMRVMIDAFLVFSERHPDEYRLFSSFMDERPAALFSRFMKERFPAGLALWAGWFSDADSSAFRAPAADVQRLLMWLLAGIKMEISAVEGGGKTPESLRDRIMERFDAASLILSRAIYGDASRSPSKEPKRAGA